MASGAAAVLPCTNETTFAVMAELLREVIALHQRQPIPEPQLSIFADREGVSRPTKKLHVWEYQRKLGTWTNRLLQTDTVQGAFACQ